MASLTLKGLPRLAASFDTFIFWFPPKPKFHFKGRNHRYRSAFELGGVTITRGARPPLAHYGRVCKFFTRNALRLHKLRRTTVARRQGLADSRVPR